MITLQHGVAPGNLLTRADMTDYGTDDDWAQFVEDFAYWPAGDANKVRRLAKQYLAKEKAPTSSDVGPCPGCSDCAMGGSGLYCVTY